MQEKYMKPIYIIIYIIIITTIYPLNAQITVAIADFKNSSDSFYLNSWEQSVPDFLKSELSRSDEILVVERRQLEAVLKEQALNMTGLVDTSAAQKVGNLLGAEYVITGTINQLNEGIRIDAKIIHISTGQVKSEKVQAPDNKYLSEMVTLLGNNIIFLFSGKGIHQEKMTLEKYPTGYFLAASAGLAIGTLLVNNSYQNKLDEYHQATRLSEFDDSYDAANDLNKVRITMATLTGIALIGTLYCWINNMSPDEIIAYHPPKGPGFIPVLAIDGEGVVYATINIWF
jgi:TolB-like protein